MSNDQIDNEIDDLFEKGLQDINEEQASQDDWLMMKSRMKKEGLLKSRIKKRLILISLLLAGISSIGIWYYFNQSDVSRSAHASNVNAPEKTGNRNNTGSDVSENMKKESEPGKNDNKRKIEDNSPKASFSNSSSKLTDESPNHDKKSETISLKKENKKNSSPKQFLPGSRPESEHNGDLVLNEDKGSSHSENDLRENKNGEENLLNSENSESPITDQKQQVASTSQNPSDTLANEINTGTANPDTGVSASKNILPHQDSTKEVNSKTTEENIQANQRKRFFIGGYFSLDYNHYLLKENGLVPPSEADYVDHSDSINGKNSASQFTAGLTAGYRIAQNTEIEMGVFYSRKKELTANIMTPAYINDLMQQVHSNYIYNYNASYFELSGKVKYYFCVGTKKWIYAGAGGIASFNFPENPNNKSYYSHTLYNDTTWISKDKVTLEPSSASFTAILLGGFETALSNRWNAFVEPEYKYGFSPVIKHPSFDYIPVNHYWRTFSIGFGLKYSL